MPTGSTELQDVLEAELRWWTSPGSPPRDAATDLEPEQFEMDVDPRTLRNALGQFATGVCVVTTRTADGVTAGLTVNSFSSVSLNPPLVSWCLARKAPSLRAFLQAARFSVHVLAADQRDIAMHFANPAEDKFSGVQSELEAGFGDVPVLKNTAARFECWKASTIDGGDHMIFIGRVQRFDHSERQPLLFHAGRFRECAMDAPGIKQ